MEETLIAEARRGDVQAFSRLVETYQERAIRVACSFLGNWEDARDVAQEAFVKAYENLASFKEESRFYTWFYRLLVNHCKDFLRRKKARREESDPDPLERAVSSVPNPREQVIHREIEAEIYIALDRLPFQQRNAFTLRYLEGMSLEEIAGIMNLSLGAVKAHLWQAAQKMRRRLASRVTEGGRSDDRRIF